MEKKHYDIIETSHGCFQTTFNKKHTLRKPWTPANPKHIRSMIPGTIVEIMVSEGQEVKAGDTLLLFKAMKMNNVIKAPFDGKVARIDAKEGENVSQGVVIIELE